MFEEIWDVAMRTVLVKAQRLLFLATYVHVVPRCICSAVSRLIRFRGCIVWFSLRGYDIDPITKTSDNDRNSFNTPRDWTLSLQASSRIRFIVFYLCYLV